MTEGRLSLFASAIACAITLACFAAFSASVLVNSASALSSSSSSFDYEISYQLLAEFVTVDYLWDSNHTRAVYEENGQFVVTNNIITGVKVSKNNEIFVTVPRWMSGVPSSLNKLVQNPNGPGFVLMPWPSWEFNAFNVTGMLQYAQSMLIDSNNLMWIPDVGRTNWADPNPNTKPINGPPFLYVVDVSNGSVVDSYKFPESVLPYNSTFLNDLVLDEKKGFVYMSNTYDNGGIVVFDINTRTSKMFVGIPSTQRNNSYDVIVNGFDYGTNGVGSSPSDGIALSPDLSTLYWSPVQGVGIWSIKTSFLQQFSKTDLQFQENIVLLGYKPGFSDGMLFMNNYMLFGDIVTSRCSLLPNVQQYTTTNSISPSMTVNTPSSPGTLNWIDTFSIDFNDENAFYFTTNRLNLFFAGTMDFTGQSGSNMRLFYATVGTSDDDDKESSSSNSSKKNLSGGALAAIILGCLVSGFLIGIVTVKIILPNLTGPNATIADAKKSSELRSTNPMQNSA